LADSHLSLVGGCPVNLAQTGAFILVKICNVTALNDFLHWCLYISEDCKVTALNEFLQWKSNSFFVMLSKLHGDDKVFVRPVTETPYPLGSGTQKLPFIHLITYCTFSTMKNIFVHLCCVFLIVVQLVILVPETARRCFDKHINISITERQ
jgi:hypothetical protein